ncbi:hypothetical protein GCM10023082_63690 [Streptomyces tremellae]|uniref:Uncharacterized protein n=1 Tax=Streptomyces tremellae TaxID=1124239 RepID=A0ABP7GAS5_9ACTN
MRRTGKLVSHTEREEPSGARGALSRDRAPGGIRSGWRWDHHHPDAAWHGGLNLADDPCSRRGSERSPGMRMQQMVPYDGPGYTACASAPGARHRLHPWH